VTNLILAGTFDSFGKVEKVYDEFMELRGEKGIRSIYCNNCEKRYTVTVKNETTCPVCKGGDIETDFDKIKDKKFDIGFEQERVFGFKTNKESISEHTEIILKEKCMPLSMIEEMTVMAKIKCAFEIKKIKKIIDKNDNEMAFLDITDGDYETSIVIFSNDWEDIKESFKIGGCYIAILQKSSRGNNFIFSMRNGQLYKLERKK
jgi:DNA polymerase III alpha subunit